MVIARGEDLLARHINQPAKLRQRRAFMIIGVAKTQPDRVPLIMKLRVRLAHAIDELRDPIHLLLALCNETFRRAAEINDPSAGFLFHELENLSQN
jgi:hypothetical protein